MHLAIESALDVGNHVISERGYRKPEIYGGIFVILSQESVVFPELYEKLKDLEELTDRLLLSQ